MTYKPTSRFTYTSVDGTVKPIPAESYYLMARAKEIELAAVGSGEDYFDVQAMRKKLMDSVPKMGGVMADELLLKLGSWLNERKR